MTQTKISCATERTIYKFRTLTGIRNAILKHKKVWLTRDDKNYVYVELKKDGQVWIHYGLNTEITKLHQGIINIDYFLSFQRSTDLLGG